MSKLMIACATLLLGLCTTSAGADTLPLPDSLTGFSTHDGEVYFGESDAHEAYFPLASNFLTQKTQAYCGVASIVMVLNALGVPAPAVPEYAPYRTFTQDNVLSERTDAVLPRETLAHQGMTLDQLIAGAGQNPDPSMRNIGGVVQGAAARVDQLAAADAALRGASAWSRPFVFLGHADWGIARATWAIYRPAVPTTAEGFVYAAMGMIFALAIFHLAVKAPISAYCRGKAAKAPPVP